MPLEHDEPGHRRGTYEESDHLCLLGFTSQPEAALFRGRPAPGEEVFPLGSGYRITLVLLAACNDVRDRPILDFVLSGGTMRRTIFALTLGIAALAACGNVKNNPDAPPPPTDVPVDAGVEIDATDAMVPIDAAIDAPAGSPGQEFNGAAGRVGGATFTMDVQLGHPVGQQQLQGTTYRLEANTPIKP